MTAQFGPVMQNGFVVRDLDRALDHWTRVVGVGPFFVLERVPFDKVWFRDALTDIDLTVAIAYWGDMQIELIRQNNTAASIYTEFASRGGTGLQHMGVITESVEGELARLAARGVHAIQHGSTRTGMRFAYVDTDHHPGGMIELIESGPAVLKFFRLARDAAREWDGTDPVRRLG